MPHHYFILVRIFVYFFFLGIKFLVCSIFLLCIRRMKSIVVSILLFSFVLSISGNCYFDPSAEPDLIKVCKYNETKLIFLQHILNIVLIDAGIIK